MKMSEQGLDLLIQREGKRNTAYRDSVGVWTIGVGHTGPEVHEGLVWTDEQIKEAFAKDIERFERAANDGIKVEIPQHSYDGVLSWLFNVGADWARKATLIRMINAGNMEAAAEQFDNWHIPPEITSRRNGEKHQFIGDRFEARIT